MAAAGSATPGVMAEAAAPVRVSVAHGAGAAGQQALLDAWLRVTPAVAGGRAVLAEGAWLSLHAPDDVPMVRLPAGCVCCVGAVTLRVALTRLLRATRPAQVLLLLARAEHRDRLPAQLAAHIQGVAVDAVLWNADGVAAAAAPR
jgi:hypothetical protein